MIYYEKKKTKIEKIGKMRLEGLAMKMCDELMESTQRGWMQTHACSLCLGPRIWTLATLVVAISKPQEIGVQSCYAD